MYQAVCSFVPLEAIGSISMATALHMEQQFICDLSDQKRMCRKRNLAY